MIKDICFTGHRPNAFGNWNDPPPQHILDWLDYSIQKMIDQNETVHFISGAAQGVDQWAAEIILDKKFKHKKIKLTMAMPYLNFGSNWPENAYKRLTNILDFSDDIKYVYNGEYTNNYLLQLRNEWMVDHSDLVIAIWDGNMNKSGTGNCVSYAKQQKVDILHYNWRNKTEQFIKFQ